jgi:hypothetical protein
MIISKKVQIEINNRSICHFKRKLKSIYDLKVGLNEICVSDLSKGSHIIVEVECDSCYSIIKTEYRTYLKLTKNETEIYCCKKCNNVKVRKTNLEKYGVVCNSQLNSNKKMVTEKWQNKTEDEKSLIVNSRKETSVEKYGVDCYTKTDDYKTKSKETWMKRYDVENPSYSEDIKQKRVNTKLKKFGFINNSQSKEWKDRIEEIWNNRTDEEIQNINKKRSITTIEKYGVASYSTTEDFHKKCILTCLLKYGYPSHNQSPKVHQLQQISAFKTKKYSNTDLTYQGTYELDFLEKYYNVIKIEKINPIKYTLNENTHYYHPDFYLPEYNLIIEIKSSYTYNYELDKNIAKKEHSIKSGYNFLFIIDKDYSEFEYYLN